MISNKKNRLLVLTSTFPRWKNDHEPPFVYELARRLVADWEVHVLAPHTAGAAPFEVLGGVNVHRFRYAPVNMEKLAYEGGMLGRLRQSRLRYFLLPVFLLFQFLAARRIVRSYSIDVIHAHWIIPQGFIASLVGLTVKKKIPVMCTSHGADLFSLQGVVMRSVKRMVIKRCTGVTVVSNAMEKELARIDAKPRLLETIPMGIDLKTRFVPKPDGRRPNTIVFVGRLVEKKGLKYLLEALPRVLERNPEIRLLIAGSGPEEESLRSQAAQLGIDMQVEFLGAIDNARLPIIFQRAAIAVFPFVTAASGDQEGFGLVIVEALGCGCAVIASELPAVRDILKDGETGLLVPQKEPLRLATAIGRLVEDPGLCSSLAQAGRQQVYKQFDWEIIAGRYNTLLHSLL